MPLTLDLLTRGLPTLDLLTLDLLTRGLPTLDLLTQDLPILNLHTMDSHMITQDEKQKILVTEDIPVINLHIRYMDTQGMINLDVDTLARDTQSMNNLAMNTLVAIIPDMNTMGKIPTMSTLWVKTRNMNTKERRELLFRHS